MNFNFNQKSGARICPEKNICYFCTRNTDNTPPVEFRSVMQLIEKGAREWVGSKSGDCRHGEIAQLVRASDS